ncbi:hypothetical protein ACPPTR_08885 [Ralstonia pseudosolanacearum]|uniref:hypothetical protein n=1 Tax=Ralstonia pseudosolanacearum TaxID=1310165 RepID=UPI000AD2C8B4|nr:hypothetical protein [Ralstonia pseudosolanacearum]MDO3559438.1 hypothetical protein [Ralstonia pseudosolanacearum]MDO3579084.1 hypothetical protein [Ralstonia pseudosolanacearum]MDO3588749.1 hypothetical protein [Ralstonia pseudosolanacearum]
MKEQVVTRLTPEVYAALEEKVPPPNVTTTTTELLAGYQLGVQVVLKLLREGYVVSR